MLTDDTQRDLHPLEETLLDWLSGNSPSTDAGSMEGTGMDEGSYRRAVQWLLSRELAESVDSVSTVEVELGPLGMENLKKGTTPELALLDAVREGARELPEIQRNELFDRGRWGSAMGALLKSGVLGRGPDGLTVLEEDGGVFTRMWEQVYLPLSEKRTVHFGELDGAVAGTVTERAPRRGKSRAEFVLNESTANTLVITDRGRKALELSAGRVTIGKVTREVLSSGRWREGSFRRYQVDIPPARIHLGRLHPYGIFLDTVRDKLQAMGFREMKGSLAENEFWNNDALFMPQFHPARDIHDAYYLEEGVTVPRPDESTGRAVMAAHQDGGDTGGRGWEYHFQWERSLQAILRSQGTALSARTLGSGPDIPGKYFGIAKCFRYDQVDATHLPDFYQVEGIVLGREINLKHLLGLLKLFATEVAGASEFKFVPGYFPFTEPSVEIHIKHPVLGWFEMGGAGLFRREVCRPLGVEVPVIAWGLGLDRMALMALGLSDIRDLMTPDLGRLRGMTVRPEQLLGGGQDA
jgi:phenylalanyl-tRNA synthetase alpha chain